MIYRFDSFALDLARRQLRLGNALVDINSRYFDALSLLVAEPGALVSKQRFHDEVWRGVPVTDEALTQCIAALRRLLGDSASQPRFIETVPKHGYRFIAPVEQGADEPPFRSAGSSWRAPLAVAGGGTIGGGLAGLVGGLAYGFAGASQPLAPGMGSISVLLVLTAICVFVAVVGAAGVSAGVAAAGRLWRPSWLASSAGGTLGGLLIGALAKLLGVDAFTLLLGRSPGDVTGAAEGALLGGAVGLAAWIASRASLARGAAAAAAIGGAGGALIVALGGQLMAGSLDSLARSFPASRLRLDLIGEGGFGTLTRLVSGTLEGALFAAAIVAAMMLARRDAADRG